MATHAEKVDKLAEIIDREPKPSEPIVGTKLWTPCSGMERKGRQMDHAGEIREAREVDGHVEWRGTDRWTSFDEAQERHPKIIRDTSHGLCPRCRTKT